MQTIDLVFIAIALLSVFSVGVSIYTLFAQLNQPDNQDLQRQINALNSDFSDHFDKVQQWMRRDSTRRARAGKVDSDDFQMQAVPIIQPMDNKAALRAKLNRRNQQMT